MVVTSYGTDTEMKFRENKDFLKKGNISEEAQDYVNELHDIIWRFIRVYCPRSGGALEEWVPKALKLAEKHHNDLQAPNTIDG